MNSEHTPTYHRHQIGRSPISGRAVHGWDVECSCGWTRKSHNLKEYVQRAFREHVKSASVPPTEEA